MDSGQNRGTSLPRSPSMEMGEGHNTSQKGTTPPISLTLWRLQGRGWQDYQEFRGTSPSLEIWKRRRGLPEFRGTHPLWVDDALKGMGRNTSESQD